MNFHFTARGIARYFMFIHFCISNLLRDKKIIGLEFLLNYNEVFFFTLIDRQNVNANDGKRE